MSPEQIRLVVRKPLSDIEGELRKKYGLKGPLVDVSIEQDALSMVFDGSNRASAPREDLQPDRDVGLVPATAMPANRRRRKRRVRNRMKTRGWDVVAKFVNSKGQSCTIYRPMLEALAQKGLTRRQAYGAVREILLSNGNRPSPPSIDYFLNNTIEYLRKTERTEANT